MSSSASSEEAGGDIPPPYLYNRNAFGYKSKIIAMARESAMQKATDVRTGAFILLSIWVVIIAVLFGINGIHLDFHSVSLGMLLVFGCSLITSISYLISVRLRERERAEALLRQSQERYISLVENSLTGIFIDQDGVFRFSNERFAEAHGLARGDRWPGHIRAGAPR